MLTVVFLATWIVHAVASDDSYDRDKSDLCDLYFEGTPVENEAPIPDLKDYNEALAKLDIEAVYDDIKNLLTDSQDCWPADEYDDGTSYGPFMIRLAWHCSGTFRSIDGKGGCTGGRQRFSPEKSWADNTNLDKARGLLAPIKEKYGIGLSWGDLMIMAGNTAIVTMDGPVKQMCLGRIDEKDGTNSQELGEGDKQPPCPNEGDCPQPLGQTATGLIYVNPEGFLGDPDPEKSAAQIREIFGRMDMDDRETVALIGGGHEFGKAHGACPDGAGPNPSEDPYNSWPGNCGTGKGKDTCTSGLEVTWTRNPLRWDNTYFVLLNEYEYELYKGPGDKWQWKNLQDPYLNMFTTDMALIYDKDYEKLVDEFANDIDALNEAFENAWDKLTTRGGEWADEKRCFDFSDIGNTDKKEKDGKEKDGKDEIVGVPSMGVGQTSVNGLAQYGFNINTILLGLILMSVWTFICVYYKRTQSKSLEKTEIELYQSDQ